MIAIALLVTIEAIRTPVGFTRFNGIPQVYDRLAAQSDVVVAEFPFYSGANVSLNGPYVLANTRYFKPLLNGYSSFHPESFEERGRALNSFPSEVGAGRVAGRARHARRSCTRRRSNDAMDRRRWTRSTRSAELQFVADEDGIRLYRLK